MAGYAGLMMAELPPLPTPAGVRPPYPPLGHWPLVYAALVFALALGVWRRRPWAWWGFFVLLAASACWLLYGMQMIGDVGPPIAVRLVFAAMCCVVIGLWGRWWYGQRKHFIWS
jgi:hypothetical protein